MEIHRVRFLGLPIGTQCNITPEEVDVINTDVVLGPELSGQLRISRDNSATFHNVLGIAWEQQELLIEGLGENGFPTYRVEVVNGVEIRIQIF